MDIWDTAGQERYKSLTPMYMRGALGCLLVYDICDRNSFDSLASWIDTIPVNANTIVVGNKTDLKFQRKASIEE